MRDINGLPGFVGRQRELAVLDSELQAARASGRGRFVLVRGRRRVGKSWLVEHFIGQRRLPHVFFTAARTGPDRRQELNRFAEELTRSTVPEEARAPGVAFATWEAALTTGAIGATPEHPTVLIIDEFPYLGDGSDREARSIESMVSAAWERRLSRLPVLLILVGSDLAMMERLTEHGRPLYDRPTRLLIVDPLTPRDIADIGGFSAEQAFDAYAVIGGMPGFAEQWRRAGSLRGFLRTALSHEDTSFVNSGVRILDAEFPADLQARVLLSAIGHGQRTSAAISSASGIPTSNLDRSIKLLSEAKRIVRVDEPLSAIRLRAPRYSVADPYLRFWLRFVEPALPEIARLRTERVVDRILAQWPDYRGSAVEPILRSALERLLPDDRLPGAEYVGSYWTRKNDPEVDLIGADAIRAPAKVAFAGSIKWRENRPFASRDLEQLITKSAQVPGVTPATRLVAISRKGVASDARRLDVSLGPEDLLVTYPARELG